MDNIFVTNLYDGWIQELPSRKIRIVNNLLQKLGFWARLSTPVNTGGMTSVEQRINMYHLASSVLLYDVSGDFVEVGCHSGQSATLFQKIIRHFDTNRTLHVYDSFEGLPEVSPEDGKTSFEKGQMATTREVLLSNFQQLGLEPPVVHQGWFEDTLPTELPERIAFAHLDGDLYASVKTSLEYVYPKLSKGAVCLIDDYCDPAIFDAYNPFPGVKQACDEFMIDKREKVSVLYAGYDSELGYGSHGYFRKD